MFEDRKSVFVDLLKWDLPVIDGRFEIDEFDDEHATYVIVADEDGDISARPASFQPRARHILGSLFPELCAGQAPSGPDIFEITRFCLSRRQTAASRRRTRNRLVSALVWHALGARDPNLYRRRGNRMAPADPCVRLELPPARPPLRFESGMLGALAIEIGSDTPALLAANGMWDIAVEPPVGMPQAA